MAIARSIEQRIAEAVHIKLAADADLIALCGASKILYGPEGGFDVARLSIVPPQIHVLPGAVQARPMDGVGGKTDRDVQVVVAYFGKLDPKPIATGGNGASSGVSVCKHINLLLNAGASDDSSGRLADPDDSLLRVTLALRSVRTSRPQPISASILGWIIEATFYTRENASGVRS